MKKNRNVKCDVVKCAHNDQGCRCELDQIKITCGCGEQCTCCGDYQEKE